MAKVLIVDDSSLGRKLLKRVLLKINHEIIAEAEDGEKGIIEYKRLKPDIVTMDVDMPGINGLEASSRILKDYPDAKIVIISGHEKNDLKEGIDKYGLKHYIIKPVTEENVSTAFQKILSDSDASIPVIRDIKRTGDSKVINGPLVKVSVNHHSVLNIFFAKKVAGEESISTLVIDEGTQFSGFREDDPIILGYESNGLNIISQCEITGLDPANRYLNVKIINSLPLEDENLYQNFPASIFTDIRLIGTRKRYPAVIKTLMVNEMILLSEEDIKADEKVSMDIIHKSKVLTIDGSIISKFASANNKDYLVKLDFNDYNMKKAYISYIQELADNFKKSISHLDTEVKL